MQQESLESKVEEIKYLSSIHKDLKLKEAREEEELKVPQYRALEKVTFCTIPPFYTITMTVMTVIRKAYLP